MFMILGSVCSTVLMIIIFFFKSSAKALEKDCKEKEEKYKTGNKKTNTKIKGIQGNIGVLPNKKTKETKAEKNIKRIRRAQKLMLNAIKVAIRVVNLIINVCQMLIQAIVFIASNIVIILVVLAVVLVVSFISVVLLGSSEDVSFGGSNQNISSNNGLENSTTSTEVQTIINMSDEEVWRLLSDDSYGSYKEANAKAKDDEEFWESKQIEIEVPVWKFVDKNDYTKGKEATTLKLTIHKELADFWKEYITEIHNLPEQYVIEGFHGFSWRLKTNNSDDYSSHAFGTAVDINAFTDGMGYTDNPSNTSTDTNMHYATSTGLKDPVLSMACTTDSSWLNLSKKYRLDWGGYWNTISDAMHFSIVGDNSRDTLTYTPKYEGRTP